MITAICNTPRTCGITDAKPPGSALLRFTPYPEAKEWANFYDIS